ncbi:cytochrome c family protein [Methylopila sp. 73B]|uniref:c-type cytochrome n=1 Tax=Methylopila sp. 73B TaxID=1120792 RepID=UPI00037A2910|nr:cytochrome c family protein [Methylopila sp. 73B]
MDSFELNKIAGAVLGALTVTLTLNAVAGLVFGQHEPEKPGYEVAALDESGGGEAGGGAAAAAPIEARLAKADPAKGEAVAKKCGACHSFEKGGAAKAGPNLYGVVGLKHAHMEGFGYSAAMKATTDKTWDFANLDHWIENPKGYISGTSMAFAGIKNPEERANLLAYLNKNSDSPQPLPAAPAEGAKPAAAGGDKGAAAPAAGGGDFKALVAAADVKKGEAVAKKCGACHSFDKGGPAKAGPNLYGIVGLKHAHMEGFGYSAAMKATSDKVWDVDNLGHWLESPKAYVPGTSMAFAGIKSPEERAALIAYLNKNSDAPVDLGAAGGGDAKPAAPAEAAPAPQEGAAPGQPGATPPAEQPK